MPCPYGSRISPLGHAEMDADLPTGIHFSCLIGESFKTLDFYISLLLSVDEDLLHIIFEKGVVHSNLLVLYLSTDF